MAEKQGFKTNYPYKKWLESLKRLDSKKLSAIAAETHHSVFSKLDCLHCANCCKNIPPIINETDVNRIAKYLRIKPTNFKQQFTQHDEDGDLVINQTPCPFLGADPKPARLTHIPMAMILVKISNFTLSMPLFALPRIIYLNR